MTSLTAPPDFAVAPGEHLAEWLHTRQPVDQDAATADLARRLGLDRSSLDRLLVGGEPLGPDLALRLARITGVPAWRWNQLEAHYREVLATAEDDQALAEQYGQACGFPLAYLRRYGHLEPVRTPAATVAGLLDFLRAGSIEAWRLAWEESAAPYRRAALAAPGGPVLATWLIIGERLAPWSGLPTYDARRLALLVPQPGTFAAAQADDQVRQVAADLAEAGVALVLVPEVPGLGVRAATRWVGAHPLVQLTPPASAPAEFWSALFSGLDHLLHDSRDGLYLVAMGSAGRLGDSV